MDEAFFQELDSHISNIGSDKVWKRSIGGVEVWFTPISFTGQGKATDQLLSDGNSTLQETKRITLANSIVGFDSFDLRKYRNAGPVFPVEAIGPDGARIRAKVDLQKYVYGKIAGWDSEFVDVAYKVFADLMESHSRFLVKDVKFENLKSPTEELAELEQRVAAIRDQLDLPQLVEPDRLLNEEEIGERARELRGEAEVRPRRRRPVPSEEELPEPEEGQERGAPVADSTTSGPMTVDFDPFETSPGPALEDAPPVRSVPVPVPPSKPVEMSPIDRELLARASRPRQPATVVSSDLPAGSIAITGPSNTPDTAHPVLPSVDVGVLEEPGRRQVVPPPKIDRSAAGQSPNPRFQRPSGGSR